MSVSISRLLYAALGFVLGMLAAYAMPTLPETAVRAAGRVREAFADRNAEAQLRYMCSLHPELPECPGGGE